MVDVLIIGAGVTGCAAARCLSKYELSVTVVEKFNDVSCGTSKANSGIVHAGHDSVPGTLKARLNVAGNKMFDALSEALDFPFRRTGALVCAFEGDDQGALNTLLERGKKNGVGGLSLLDREDVRRLEPNISDKVTGALFAETSGIVSPYEMTIALAENAAENGVCFVFEKTVSAISKKGNGFLVKCADGTAFEARTVVNCAGTHADEINNLISETKFTMSNRKGEYYLYDKTKGSAVSHTIFQLPGVMGKGVLITLTTHGNLLIGPTALDIPGKDDTSTTTEELTAAFAKAKRTLPALSKADIITSFAGLRAHRDEDDFLICESEVAGFFNVCGIESPGLTAAPAIGEMVSEMVVAKLRPAEKKDFISKRKNSVRFFELDDAEKAELIKENPLYGRVICRCEEVTEGEIVDSIHRPVGAVDLDGVKRRTRAGMGRCQSGFCGPKVLEIIARERGIPVTEVTKCGGTSQILIAKNKENGYDEL